MTVAQRKSGTPSDYHRMSLAEKQAATREQWRPSPVRCGECNMSVMPEDLLPHLRDRCAGRPDPGPSAKWLTLREAVAMGVPRRTLTWWAEQGFIRVKGGRMDRKYLLVDVAQKIAQRLGFRRR